MRAVGTVVAGVVVAVVGVACDPSSGFAPGDLPRIVLRADEAPAGDPPGRGARRR